MRKLLLASVFALAVSPALADSIVASATVDGVLVAVQASANGTLDVNNQAFGVFNLNTLSINSQTFLAGPGVLRTNTLNINQTNIGNHELILDIVASGLTGTGALANFLSSFSVTGMDPDWSVREQTFINGVLLADTGIFTGISDNAFSFNSALMTNPFSVEALYTINSVGVGQFNGGINVSVAAVPGPVVGAGLPGILAMFGAGGWFWKRRKAIG